MNLGVMPPLIRVGFSLKKVHEWIEHMAIKVQTKKKKKNFVHSCDSGCVCVCVLFLVLL